MRQGLIFGISLVTGKMYFTKRRLNKYMRYDISHNCSSFVGYVLADKRILRRLVDAHVIKGPQTSDV